MLIKYIQAQLMCLYLDKYKRLVAKGLCALESKEPVTYKFQEPIDLSVFYSKAYHLNATAVLYVPTIRACGRDSLLMLAVQFFNHFDFEEWYNGGV